MKHLWNYIDRLNRHAEAKYRSAELILAALYGLLGFAGWLIAGRRLFSAWDWMVCFIGYPVIISRLVVFLYYCNHDFHDGITEKRR